MKAIVRVKTTERWYGMEYTEIRKHIYEDENEIKILSRVERDIRHILNPRDIEIEFVEEG